MMHMDEIPEYGSGVRGKFFWNPETQEMQALPYERKRTGHHAYVMTDEIPETESMATADRRYFTSKKKLFQHYKENGYECTFGEFHKEAPKYIPDEREMREDLERIENDIRWGNIPFTEEEKVACNRENRMYQNWKKRMGYK